VPFLRVIRDKRGYETTYLMHWYREGAKQRSRILYVFRTPGGVRVGRGAMEADVLRTLQAQYPDIQFDWKAVLDNQQVIESAPEPRRQRKRRRSDEPASAAPARAPAEPSTVGAASPGAESARPRVPSAIEGNTDEEKIAFLTRWYERLRERIPHRTSDPSRRDALLALAERLNPATWAGADADQTATAMQQAAEALERLSRVFAKRRRRLRKPKRPDQAVQSDQAAQSDQAVQSDQAAHSEQPARSDQAVSGAESPVDVPAPRPPEE
jgi:hypothetical protein